MSEPMPASTRDAIRARRDAAAEGPYEPEWDSCDCDDPAQCGLGHRWVHALRLPEPHTRNHEGKAHPWEFLYSEMGQFTPETVLFFAAARQDVGDLLAEVDRLTSALEESRRDTHCARTDYSLARTRADKAEAECDRLRVELDTARAAMSRALGEAEHENAVFLLHRYLTVFPATTGEGE
ncbi:hypothetical protein [Streptosporangium sp. CA-115845]|uniref:hypothetical protein n=1 Tax=Streptosporangium sp. CA-115845 TaxID=3240071 RepID=UPI003D8BE330